MNNDFLMIGCGNMGSALLNGWVATQALEHFDTIHVVKKTAPVAGHIISSITYHTELSAIKLPPALVILAVKPKDMEAVLKACQKQFGIHPVYISIAAGVHLSAMQRTLGADASVIRAMPNTPTQIQQGITGLCADDRVGKASAELATELFSKLGLAIWIKEAEMDAFTALCGSGPAYTYYFTQCLAEAAAKLGLHSVSADLLARYMMLGAAALAVKTPQPLEMLRQNVTSKGGTTEAALEVFMQPEGLKKQAELALQAALQRAGSLAKIF